MAQEQAHDALGDELTTPPRSTGLVGFLVPVVLVAGLGVGGLFLYNQHVTVKEEVAKRAQKARDKMYKHDVASLEEAKKLYTEILDLDPGNQEANAALALTYYYLNDNGVAGSLDKARQHLQEAGDAETASRYAAAAYLKVADGKAAEAEADVIKLFEQEIGAPVIAHAMGVALKTQGKFIEANRVIRSAQESAFSAVAFQLTLAEIAHLQGDDRAAVKQLRDITRDSMNPNHDLARAYLAALQLKNYGNLTNPAQNIERAQKTKNFAARGEGMLLWAEGELALAVGNAEGAINKADEALKKMPDFAPLYDLQGRAHYALGRFKKAGEAYAKAAEAKPAYRGPKWDLAELKSEQKDDAALAIVDELEKSALGTKGPEYEIFRGDHALRKGEIEKAKEHYTKAAELGDNPDILFGLAKVTFEEEKAKGNKADIEKVGEALSLALDKRRLYPEVHEYLGEISLWNYLVDGADASYKTAEDQYKKLRRPIPEVVRFYDRVIGEFKGVKERKIKKAARKMAGAWGEKKREYLRSLSSAS